MKYTTFCHETKEVGTTHITCVEADSLEEAMIKGLKECCDNWNAECGTDEDDESPCYSDENVACIGVAEGDVKILHWEDPYV